MIRIQFRYSRIAMFLCAVLTGCLLLSCGCPTCEECVNGTTPTVDPVIREATVTEFNAAWNPPDPANPNGGPSALYSIHTFRFPHMLTSSGNLPNYDKVAEGRVILLQRNPVFTDNGESYYAELTLERPNNDVLHKDTLDVMVSSVTIGANPGENSAYLRFAGNTALYRLSLMSASADEFFHFVKTNLVDLLSLKDQATIYGQGIGNGRVRTTDEGRRRIYQLPGPVDITSSQLAADLIIRYPNQTNFPVVGSSSTEVLVRIGDVFFYQAVNGRSFVVLIEDIRPSSLPPYLNRVTMKFAELFKVVPATDC